jgi:hypothetical protein
LPTTESGFTWLPMTSHCRQATGNPTRRTSRQDQAITVWGTLPLAGRFDGGGAINYPNHHEPNNMSAPVQAVRACWKAVRLARLILLELQPGNRCLSADCRDTTRHTVG